jgi:hypothetical protein
MSIWAWAASSSSLLLLSSFISSLHFPHPAPHIKTKINLTFYDREEEDFNPILYGE